MSPIELKNKRISLGISTKEVADYLGMKNHLRVSKFEDGEEGKLSDMDVRKYEMFLECKLSHTTSHTVSPFEVQLTMPTEDPKEKAKAEKEKRKKAPAKKLSNKNDELWTMESSLTLPDNFILVDTEEKLKEAVETISKEEIRIVDTETYGDTSKQAKNPHTAKFCGVQIWCPNADKGYWIPAVSEHMTCLPLDTIVKYLKTVLDKNCTPIGNCYVQRRIKINGVEQIEKIPVPYKLVTHNYR